MAQLFGSVPHEFERCAAALIAAGFDGIDLNFGCPDPSVSGKQGAGAAVISQPQLAKDIIAAAKRGAGAAPVSVKTRIGVDEDVAEAWMMHLVVRCCVSALTIVDRTSGG